MCQSGGVVNHPREASVTEVSTIGLDLAKNVFSLHGVDAHGKAVLRKTLTRAKLLELMAQLPACLVGMEACSGAHQMARDLQALGERILDEPHAGELTHDVHAGAAGLEELVDLGQLDAAFGAAEDQLDGVDGALDRALAVADALGRVQQRRDPVDQAQDLSLGTGADAGTAGQGGNSSGRDLSTILYDP